MWAGQNSALGPVSVAAWCLSGHSGDVNDGDDCDGDCDGDAMRWQGVMAMKWGCALPRRGDEVMAMKRG